VADVTARKMALRALYSEDAEADAYVRQGVIYFALIHLQLACVLAGWLPLWSFPLIAPIWMARMMIGRHELIHVRKETQVDFFTRLWPVLAMVTPFSAGFREYRLFHHRHHQYMLTGDDPDLHQIEGSLLNGWLQCLTSPEQTLIRWVMERGIDAALVRDVFLRALFFFAMAALCGRNFLWYWVPLRLTYGTALFLFSYVLHRRGARYGVFRIELPPVGVKLFCLLFGRVGWLAVCNHDLHHLNSNLSPLHLIEARSLVEG
jgi:hypothetical protein